ncbi:MAG: GNAT family N-acetyltransferase [Acidobacteria bacterium]|nr:GNAT family N-acetyltransferase [Acidobacteriota bacterium]
MASVVFAARLSKAGAEIGVATAPEMRGRGYAATAVARWSRLRSLRSRALFYSMVQTNGSSQRVTARLGLRSMGASLRLS